MNPVVVLVFALLLATPAWAQSRPPAAESRQAPKADPRAVLRAMEDAFSAVADRVTPAVVHVSTVPKKGAAGAPEEGPERFREFFGDEFYDRYFRRRPARRLARHRLGCPGGSEGIHLDEQPRDRERSGHHRAPLRSRGSSPRSSSAATRRPTSPCSRSTRRARCRRPSSATPTSSGSASGRSRSATRSASIAR